MRIVLCCAFAALFGISGLTHATAVPGQGTWETTLQGRDINGHAIAATDPDAVFAYDTVLDATWYLTANTSPLDWAGSKNWAAGLTVGTFRGWSLPEAGPECYGYSCTDSQMGELWYTQLGNVAYNGMTNSGPFKNLYMNFYWTGTQYAYAPNLDVAWYFEANYGTQSTTATIYALLALAIRPGDVLTAVPEPETYAMLLTGLVGVVLLRCRVHPRKAALV